MKADLKQSLFLLLIVLLTSFPASARVNVFFHPESGFLRAEGQITIAPSTSQASFSLFPNAQITSLWVDGLLDYKIEREPQKTIVVFELSKIRDPKSLYISYEGFLPAQAKSGQMSPELLWFPQFNFPVDLTPIQLQLPKGWEFSVGGTFENLIEEEEGIYTWQPLDYPQFTATLKSAPLTSPAEQIPLVPVEQKDQTTEQKMREKVDFFLRKLVARDERAMEELLDPTLQKRGLAQYLASLPAEYGSIFTETLWVGEKPEDPVVILLDTEKGPRFQATLIWHQAKLHSFSLTPYQPGIAPEVQSSLGNFVETLRTAVQNENHGLLQKLCADDIALETIDFLLSLNTTNPWLLKHISLDPLSIAVLINHSPATTFILNLRLTPGNDNRQVTSLDIVFF